MTILANGLDTNYITGPELQDYFVDKSTGQPLAFGKIFFYEDISRTTPKNVYQLTYNSMTGIYSYTALPNPLTLSATGTFDDGNNTNIPIYYYPFDAFGNLQLYYVVAVDSNNLLQFTRDAWPFPSSGSGGGSASSSTTLSLNNMLTNPQFGVVNFAQGSTLSVPYTSAGTSFTIAPGWVMNVAASGSGTLTIAQTPVAGSSAYPWNPPFLLTVTPGSFITSLTLTQQLNNNPDWAAPQTAGTQGYISGSVLLAPNSTITMNYLKSAGSPATQTILTQTNTSGSYTQYNATVELAAASNTSTGLNGFDTIQLVLSPTITTSFSNVQIIPLTTNAAITTFDQTPVNRQIDQMFNYYKPKLDFKPIASYLVGWDFPLNPAQFLGPSVAAQGSANTSYYIWDQTILFQTTASGVTVSRDATGALKTLSAPSGGTQLALIQYLPAPQAIEMLSRRKCVNISANASVATTATVSLWYTKTTLPSTIASNLSIVATLDANGYPATQNSTWFQVPRSGLSNATVTTTATNAAQVTIPVAPSGAASFNQIPLSGWDMQGNTDINSATFFAIVVGTASLAQNAYVLWQSISCQDGDIPTVPAAKSISQTLSDCQYYYWTTFVPGTKPATGLGAPGAICYKVQIADTTAGYMVWVKNPVVMYAAPTSPTGVITAFNPVSNNNKWYNYGASSDSGTPTEFATGVFGFGLNNPQVFTDSVQNNIAIHVSVDSRLAQ